MRSPIAILRYQNLLHAACLPELRDRADHFRPARPWQVAVLSLWIHAGTHSRARTGRGASLRRCHAVAVVPCQSDALAQRVAGRHRPLVQTWIRGHRDVGRRLASTGDRRWPAGHHPAVSALRAVVRRSGSNSRPGTRADGLARCSVGPSTWTGGQCPTCS